MPASDPPPFTTTGRGAIGTAGLCAWASADPTSDSGLTVAVTDASSEKAGSVTPPSCAALRACVFFAIRAVNEMSFELRSPWKRPRSL